MQIKDKDPLVSIIVNCHNGEKYLSYCLNSIFNQSYKNWELIFFDNCSTDKSKDLIIKYVDDKKIFYKKSEKFLNLYDARNNALKYISGEFVCFLDTDDQWTEDKLEKQVQYLKNNKEFGLVYSNYEVLNLKKNIRYVKYNKLLPEGDILSEILKEYRIGLLTVCFRKDNFKNFSFNASYNIIGDYDLIIRLCKSNKIGCIQESLAIYRFHDNNLSHKLDIFIDEMKQWVENNKEDLKEIFNFKFVKFYILKLQIKRFTKNFIKGV